MRVERSLLLRVQDIGRELRLVKEAVMIEKRLIPTVRSRESLVDSKREWTLGENTLEARTFLAGFRGLHHAECHPSSLMILRDDSLNDMLLYLEAFILPLDYYLVNLLLYQLLHDLRDYFLHACSLLQDHKMRATPANRRSRPRSLE